MSEYAKCHRKKENVGMGNHSSLNRAARVGRPLSGGDRGAKT